MQLTRQQIEEFQQTVWEYYRHNARNMPWRDNPSSYYVLVSEMMLQQTQVSRVVPKFQTFIDRFPDIASLAAAPLGDVLREWSGLGYNRRAKFLHQAAQVIVQQYDGTLPAEQGLLVKLPGIGRNTAGALLAYVYEKPVLFIETNIRTVYFQHFFNDNDQITDKEVLTLLDTTLDQEHPREWYWALMDYGAYLKREHGNNIRLSKHYVRQSKFAGSKRQIRGQVLKLLLDSPLTYMQLSQALSDERLVSVVDELFQEGLIIKSGDTLRLS